MAKVRVTKQEKASKDAKNAYPTDTIVTLEGKQAEQPIAINADLGSEGVLLPKQEHFIKQQHKDQNVVGSDQEKEKRTHKKKEPKPTKPPFNYYAKWALIIGLISLLGSPIIIPGALAPLALFLGIKSLKQIRKKTERGKAFAILAIVIGAILSLIIFISFWPVLFTTFETAWFILVAALYGSIFLLNKLVYDTIKKSNNNPERAKAPEGTLKKQHIGLKIVLMVLLTILIIVSMILMIFMRAFRG